MEKESIGSGTARTAEKRRRGSPTIVVLTDRNDLDDQLYGQFVKCKDFLRQQPVHAKSREHLKSLLEKTKVNGMLTNEQVIEELLKLAKQISDARKEGDELGLTADELAFYDALCTGQAAFQRGWHRNP